MGAVQKSDLQAARDHHQRLVALGQSIRQNWNEFYAGLVEFQERVFPNGRRAYELLNFPTFDAYLGDLCDEIDESRSSVFNKMRVVRLLGPATIRKLGKTRSFLAARLKKNGKWNHEWRECLLKMTVDEAKLEVQRVCSNLEEGRRRLIFLVLESQAGAWEEQRQRYEKLSGDQGQEGFFDFVTGWISGLTNKEILEELRGERVEETP